MIDVAEARALVGERVLVEAVDYGQVVGLLRGVPDETTAWVWRTDVQPNREQKMELVSRLELYKLRCAECDARVDVLHGHLCTDCRRRAGRARNAAYVPLCETCGRGPAVRDPRDSEGRLLCPAHGMEAGLKTIVPQAVARLQRGACYGADLEDARHVWQSVRRTRWACSECGVSRFTRPR